MDQPLEKPGRKNKPTSIKFKEEVLGRARQIRRMTGQTLSELVEQLLREEYQRRTGWLELMGEGEFERFLRNQVPRARSGGAA